MYNKGFCMWNGCFDINWVSQIPPSCITYLICKEIYFHLFNYFCSVFKTLLMVINCKNVNKSVQNLLFFMNDSMYNWWSMNTQIPVNSYYYLIWSIIIWKVVFGHMIPKVWMWIISKSKMLIHTNCFVELASSALWIFYYMLLLGHWF